MVECIGPDRLGHPHRLTPRETAHLHAIRWGLEGDDMAAFMNLFDRFRFLELRGDDTYPLWRTMLDDPDGALATAAYLEAVSTTRPAVTR